MSHCVSFWCKPVSNMAPNIGCFLSFIFLCAFLSHCTNAGLYDHLNTIEMTIGQFQDYKLLCGFHFSGLISDHSLGEASCRFMRTFRLPSERVCKRLRPIYKHMKRTYQTPDDGNSSDNSTAISGETPPEPPS